MIISLKGENFTGKSGFGLSCPKKIGWHETDMNGFERALPHFELADPKIRSKIKHYTYPVPDSYMQGDLGVSVSPRLYGLKELWQEFVHNLLDDIDSVDILSIVIDTFSQMYPICADSLLQEKQEAQEVDGKLPKGERYREQLIQIEYRAVNQRMHAIFDVVAKANKNLIIIHHMTDIWGQVMKDGQVKDGVVGRDAKGWHNCGLASSDLSDIVIEMAQGDPRKSYGNGKQDATKFYSTLVKSGEARSLRGMVIEDLTYDDLITRLNMAKGV